MAIQTLNTIKKWFKTGLKPSQDQFWDTWDSFRHKYEKVPIQDIEELENKLDTKAEKSQLEEHQNNPNAHAELFSAKENKSEKGIAGGYVPLNEFSKITHQYLDVVNNLTTGGETALLSAQQGFILQNQIDSINTLLSCDNGDLDTIQKIADVVEQIQISLDSILVNDLTTGGTTKALTAEMGKLLQTSKEDKSQKGFANGYAPLNDLAKIASQYLTIINDLKTGGSASILSAEQGVVLQNQINSIQTLLLSDNVNLDTLQEIVDAIEKVQISLDTILVNDLTTGGITKALTAEMGKQLNEIKLTATIAMDFENQITASVIEDNKVVSRSKLFNWWEWIKKQSQTISGSWTFSNAITASNATLGNQLTTLDQVKEISTLQKILDRSSYAQKDNTENYVYLLSGREGNRINYFRVKDQAKGSSLYQSKYGIKLEGENDQLSAQIAIDYGSIKLTQYNDKKTAAISIGLEKASVDNKYIFKARGLSKDYYVATLDDIPEKVLDATKTDKGIIKLAGDLEGAADAPTVKGLREKLTATIATDAETQILSSTKEDNKVVSRSTLFNWWSWQKTKNQIFTNGISLKGSSLNILPESATYPYVTTSSNNTTYCKSAGEAISIDAANSRIIFQRNDFTTRLYANTPTANRILNIPDKDGVLAVKDDFLRTPAGISSTPALIIPNGELTTTPQNGAIERDSTGQLWETHDRVRSRLITSSDGLILIPYKSLNTIQTNLETNISLTKEATSSNTTIGKIGNDSVLILNLINQLTNSQNGTIKPIVAKIEVFIKINNGFFATNWTGTNIVDQVKIIEYSGSNMVGNKIYKNPIFTKLQTNDPLSAQWSTMDLVLETIFDGISTSTSKSYYLRDVSNSRTLGAAEASFSFVFINTLTYKDPTNSDGQNGNTLLRNTNYALYLETIR